MTPVKPAARDPQKWLGFLSWLGKVALAAFVTVASAAAGAWTAWSTLESTVQAHDVMVKDHEARIVAIERQRATEALERAKREAREDAEREHLKAQTEKIVKDLEFVQRELIGRVRKPGES